MTELSQTKLKAGVLAGALRMPASTIRSLVGAGLILGQRAGPGHPDYTITDVVRVMLVELLRTSDLQTGPGSILAVNSVFADLDAVVAYYFQNREGFRAGLFLIGGWPKITAYKACLIINDRAERLALIDQLEHRDQGYHNIPLRAVIGAAVYGLSKVVHGDWEERT